MGVGWSEILNHGQGYIGNSLSVKANSSWSYFLCDERCTVGGSGEGWCGEDGESGQQDAMRKLPGKNDLRSSNSQDISLQRAPVQTFVTCKPVPQAGRHQTLCIVAMWKTEMMIKHCIACPSDLSEGAPIYT